LRAFENRVLKRILGPKREEGAGSWRRLHNEELQYLCASHVVRMIKFRRFRWVGHVAHMRGEICTKFWFENMKGRDRLEDIDGNIILEWTIVKL
jgi:hypothetical protein